MTAYSLTRHANASRRAPRQSVLTYFDLYKQRRALAKLDDHQLQDVGLTRAEAKTEAARLLWDAPQHWYA